MRLEVQDSPTLAHAAILDAPRMVGDAFLGGPLAGLRDTHVMHGVEALHVALRLPDAVGAITTTPFGTIPALPTRAEVNAFLSC